MTNGLNNQWLRTDRIGNGWHLGSLNVEQEINVVAKPRSKRVRLYLPLKSHAFQENLTSELLIIPLFFKKMEIPLSTGHRWRIYAPSLFVKEERTWNQGGHRLRGGEKRNQSPLVGNEFIIIMLLKVVWVDHKIITRRTSWSYARTDINVPNFSSHLGWRGPLTTQSQRTEVTVLSNEWNPHYCH